MYSRNNPFCIYIYIYYDNNMCILYNIVLFFFLLFFPLFFVYHFAHEHTQTHRLAFKRSFFMLLRTSAERGTYWFYNGYIFIFYFSEKYSPAMKALKNPRLAPICRLEIERSCSVNNTNVIHRTILYIVRMYGFRGLEL